jgi:tetratricopeptide (TPR) repeat protein
MSFGRLNPKPLAAAAAALLGVSAFLQSQIDPLRQQEAIEPKQLKRVALGLGGAALPFEMTLGALSGFRQVIAGLLWVRSDSFFHSGNYDAILPLIRLITWLDPNWLDPYATGAWHLTYNFTDTDQRSDRRYLPAGVALLNEGIANNSTIYDMYKEKGWLYYDKFKDYDKSAEAYEGGMKNNPDITQVGHALAHAYERAGNLEKAKAQWEFNVAAHKKILDDPNAPQEAKGRSRQGYDNAQKNLNILKVREKWRVTDTKNPVEADFRYKITRKKSKVIEVAGSWFLTGARAFDVEKGIVVEGPVDGARVEVRLQNAGYTVPDPKEFTFEVPSDLTIMQDALSTRGGKKATKGTLYIAQPKGATTVGDPNAEKCGVYGFTEEDGSKTLGVPLDKALAGAAPLSPFGQKQLVTIAYPLPYNSLKPLYDDAEVPALFAKLKADKAKIADLTKKGYHVSTQEVLRPAKFGREIDMSKDPKMYNFAAEKYDLILSFSPRNAPDFVKDRYGWNGEGLTDKRYLDTTFKPGVRMLRVVIPLTKEDITGEGEKVLAETK